MRVIFRSWREACRWGRLPAEIALVLLSLVLVAQSGCARPATGGMGMSAGDQLIIRFSPEVMDPHERKYLERLARDCGVALVYVRPVAGTAHVFKIADGDEAGVEAALQCLSRRPDIVYAERDRIVHPKGKE